MISQGLNLTDEQIKQLKQLAINTLISVIVGLVAILFGYKVIIEPQINARLNALGIEEATSAGGVGVRAVPYNVSSNPVRVKHSGVDAFVAWNGGNIKLYSDNGRTLKFGVDGATGETQINGALMLSSSLNKIAARTPITATNGSPITPTASINPITAIAPVTPTLAIPPAGSFVCLYNVSNNNITLQDSGNVILAGDVELGQYDWICGWSDGVRFMELFRSNN